MGVGDCEQVFGCYVDFVYGVLEMGFDFVVICGVENFCVGKDYFGVQCVIYVGQ